VRCADADGGAVPPRILGPWWGGCLSLSEPYLLEDVMFKLHVKW
jgi:hypothetical protein